MKIALSEQMRRIDNRTITDYGIPSLLLMENAALTAAAAIEDMFGASGLNGKSILVLCGTGNNGGDGLALCRQLWLRQARPLAALVGDPEKLSADSRINYEIISRLGIPLFRINAAAELNQLPPFDVAVDALLGIGSRGELQGLLRETVCWLNARRLPVLAIDLATGIDPDNGRVGTDAVRATRTVTFGLPKPGHIFYPGTMYTGQLNVVNIGFPQSLLADESMSLNLTVREEIQSLLPVFPANISKDNRGRVLIIGGAAAMAGAVTLAARAAARIGSGVVYSFSGNKSQPVIAAGSIESINVAAASDRITIADVERIKQIAVRCQAVAIGPGLGFEPDTRDAFIRLMRELKSPLVIDADGLNLLAGNLELLRDHPGTILTPHLKEFSRLTALPEKEILDNYLELGGEFSRAWQTILVLKGFRTVIFLPDGQKFVLPVGNSCLATAGSGDVLTGMIAGMLAMTGNNRKAALIGSYVHGYIGDVLRPDHGEFGVVSSDIVAMIPKALVSLLAPSEQK